VVIGGFIGQLQTRLRNTGKTDPFSLVARFAIEPPANAVSYAADSTSDFFTGIIRSGQLTAENRKLRQLADAEKLYNDRINEVVAENNQLLRLQGFEVPGRKRIPARIIAEFPLEDRVTLNAGADEGIVPGIAIVSGDGLLGTVQTVEAHECQASLVWSPLPYKIGAIVEGRAGVAGLIHGEDEDKLILDLNIDAPVQTGDLVVTSGFSEKIPRGIAIGKVVQVQKDEENGTARAQVFPAVQLGDVQEVVALK
jgi:rod shape-determining protein MreC